MGLGPRRTTKPVVCAVRGWCLTIGIELLLAADIRIAAADTRFGQIEVCRGIFPFGGATTRLPALTGWGNAMRYLLTGDRFDAREALRIGLVSEVTDLDSLAERGLALAERVAAQAPLAVRETLASARMARAGEKTRAEQELLAQARYLMTTEDAEEGLASFVERREATFSGR